LQDRQVRTWIPTPSPCDTSLCARKCCLRGRKPIIAANGRSKPIIDGTLGRPSHFSEKQRFFTLFCTSLRSLKKAGSESIMGRASSLIQNVHTVTCVSSTL